jgi:hypothetical protein
VTEPPAPKKKPATRYVILEVNTGEGGKIDNLKHVDDVEAASATSAIRGSIKTPGIYIAIPERSFRPVKVTVETKQTVKLG